MRLKSEKLEDRRRHIRQAATRVFARKGYHGTRIADIAEEAGVAYGLVYHYFKNKEEILASIFDANWSFFVRSMQDLSASGATLGEKIDAVVGFMVEAYRIAPEVVRVLLLEIGRSPIALKDEQMQRFRKAFVAVADLIADAQKAGRVRKGVDPVIAAVSLFGAIENVLTGVVLKLLPATPEGLDRIRKTVSDLFLRGLEAEA